MRTSLRPQPLISAATQAEHLASLIQIVDHGSLSAAARALGVPKSTLSRHLAQLEAALEAQVITRGAREVTLTEVGAQLVSEARGPLAALGEAMGNAAAQVSSPRGRLRIAAAMDYGTRMSELLLELLRQHPDIDVELVLTDSVSDLQRDRIDLAIRAGVIRDESLIARPLGWIHGVLVASPAFVTAHKVLETATSPSCLTGIPCVVFTSPPFNSAWTLHAKDQTPVEVNVSGRFCGNSLPLVRAAAVAGLGVARLPFYMAREEIAAGRLVVVLPGWASPSRPVQLVYLQKRHQSQRVRTAIQFFLRCAGERRFDG